MIGSAIRRLAVATLSECGPAAAQVRLQPDRPLQGYCLVSGDGESCRVTLFLQNGRGGASYTGWGVTATGEEPLGPFRMSSDGDGGFSDDRPVVGMERYGRIQVAAGSLGPVLEGRLVWLVGQAQQGTYPATPHPGTCPDTPHPGTSPGTSGPDRREEAAAPGSEASVRESAEPAPDQGDPGSEGGTGEERPVELGAAQAPTAAPAPASVPVTAIIDGFRRTYDPANPVSTPVVIPQRVSLTPAHAQASRATGTVQLDTRRGGLVLHVRGLPSPTQLGADPGTGRPFNVYQVWLVNQRTQAAQEVGLCARAWGDHFRLNVETGLDLKAHDLIVVTAADRGAESRGVTGPRLLSGSFSHR